MNGPYFHLSSLALNACRGNGELLRLGKSKKSLGIAALKSLQTPCVAIVETEKFIYLQPVTLVGA